MGKEHFKKTLRVELLYLKKCKVEIVQCICHLTLKQLQCKCYLILLSRNKKILVNCKQVTSLESAGNYLSGITFLLILFCNPTFSKTKVQHILLMDYFNV